MPVLDNQTIQLVIIAIAALAVVMQAIVLFAIYANLKKATRSLGEQIDDLRSTVTPILVNAGEFLTRVAPKIEETTTDVAEILHGLRERGAEVEGTAADILGRVQRQTVRLDGMLSGVLDSVDRAGGYVADVVEKPARQLSGILASVKAFVESLRASAPEARPKPGSTETETTI